MAPISQRQDGYLLIETLITIGILAVGLLGISAMQLTSLKSSYSAVQRGEAAILVSAMGERMRANPLAFFNKASENDIEYITLPAGSRAKMDFDEWAVNIDSTFGQNASGDSVAQGSVECISRVNCFLKIEWNDPRADTALSPDGENHSLSSGYRYQHVVSVIF